MSGFPQERKDLLVRSYKPEHETIFISDLICWRFWKIKLERIQETERKTKNLGNEKKKKKKGEMRPWIDEVYWIKRPGEIEECSMVTDMAYMDGGDEDG